MSNFATRLKELRLKKGLSQAQLVKELNNEVTQAAIDLWENNKRVPNLDAVILISKYFGVTLDYIAGIDEK